MVNECNYCNLFNLRNIDMKNKTKTLCPFCFKVVSCIIRYCKDSSCGGHSTIDPKDHSCEKIKEYTKITNHVMDLKSTLLPDGVINIKSV